MRERVVVLGAAGFIGRAVCDRLAPNYDLTSVDIAWLGTNPHERPGETKLRADMGSEAEIDDLFEALHPHLDRIAGVVDLVAHYDFRNEADPRYERVELGLGYLLEKVGKRLPPNAPFLYASSMASLAPTEPGKKITEQSPRVGAWAYPAHKLRCEAILESTDIPQPRGELVLAGVYGEWCELVPLYFQLERVRTRSPESFVYPGPTNRGLTYVHVEDAAAAFEAALAGLRGRSGIHRYLVGEAEPATYSEINRRAARAFGARIQPLFRVPKALARTGAAVLSAAGATPFVRPWMVDFAGEHFEFDLSHVERELGWRPSYRLQDELEGLCRRAQQHPDEWRERNEARPR